MERFHPVIEYQDFHPRKSQKLGSPGRNRLLVTALTNLAIIALLNGCTNVAPKENSTPALTIEPLATGVISSPEPSPTQVKDELNILIRGCGAGEPESIEVVGQVMPPESVQEIMIVLQEDKTGKQVVAEVINRRDNELISYHLIFTEKVTSKEEEPLSYMGDTIYLYPDEPYSLLIWGSPRLRTAAEPILLQEKDSVVLGCGEKF